MEGKQGELKNRNYCGKKFLEAFSNDIQPHKWTKKWSYIAEQAREATVAWPEPIKQWITEVQNNDITDGQDYYYLRSGKKYSAKTQKEEKQQDIMQAQEQWIITQNEQQQKEQETVATLLHESSVQLANELKKYGKEAIAMAKNLYEEYYLIEREMNLIQSILAQPTTAYNNSGVTTRLAPANPSIVLVHRKIRRILAKDFIELDLASAELAIIRVVAK